MGKYVQNYFREDKIIFAYTLNWHTKFSLAKVLQNWKKQLCFL